MDHPFPGRLIAVGDIHGCLQELRQLLEQLAPFDHRDHVVFLGDYVDRGPDSAGVIAALLKFAEGADRGCGRVTFLRGNHEQLMLDARSEVVGDLRLWLGNGGGATLDSYVPGIKSVRRGTMADIVPAEHWRFLEETEPYIEVGPYLLVHGGIDPALSVEDNLRDGDPLRFLWERRHHGPDVDLSAWGRRVVVCGHTVFEEPVRRPNLVSIDTGAFLPYLGPKPGALTAVVLPLVPSEPRQFVSVEAAAAKAA